MRPGTDVRSRCGRARAAAVVNAGGQLFRLLVEEPSLEAIYSRYFQNLQETQHAAA